MKQCPVCKTAYTDDSLQYCLSDGANLIALRNDAPTVQMSFGKDEPMRVNIPDDSAPTVFAQPPVMNNQAFSQNQPAKSNFGLIVAGLLGLLLLLVGGGLAAFFLLPRSNDNNNAAVADAKPTATVTNANAMPQNNSANVAANDETAKLREEMANLRKQLENQKKQKSGSNVSAPTYDNGSRTAYADSPGDGFLALRSEPNSEAGTRLAKIPHGAPLTVIDCPRASNVGKIPGRWCRVVYEGQAGWAFDGFMKF